MENLNLNNVIHVFIQIIEEFTQNLPPKTAPTCFEIKVASKLFDVLSEICSDYEIIEDFVLESGVWQDSQPSTSGLQVTAFDNKNNSEDSDFNFDEEKNTKEIRKIPMKRKMEIVALYAKHPRWKLTTLQKNGAKEVTSMNELYRWKKQILRGQTKVQQYNTINQFVKYQFDLAREESKIIRSSSLKQWGLEKYQEIGNFDLQFKASNRWVDNWKQKYRVSSRKITRLINKREITGKTDLLTIAANFQKTVKNISKNYPSCSVLNTDQCGFNYEILSSRTLSYKGEKSTFGFSQSPTNKATHSYTVQYTINSLGEIIGDVFLCLQEPNGKFGKIVTEKILSQPCPNVCLTCSRSGKLSTSLVQFYLEKCLAPNMAEDFLLIIDSWPGHTKIDTYNNVFGAKPKCEILVIPAKCTSMCQPLDTTFHRQLKILAREITSQLEINTENIHSDDNWTSRVGTIKLQSLIHHQLSATIFQPMIKYSWYSSGLIDEKTPFLNVKEVCFQFGQTDKLTCLISGCSNARFIKCARCFKILCLKCFYFDFHTTACSASPQWSRK